MAKRKRNIPSGSTETNQLLKDLLIVQLGIAGVPQLEIREIVGGEIKRVNKIVRLISSRKPKPKKGK